MEVWDVPTRRLLRSLPKDKEAAWGHVAFSPVRNLLAATSGTNAVILLDLDSDPAREVLTSTIDFPQTAPDETVGMTLGRYKLEEVNCFSSRGVKAMHALPSVPHPPTSHHPIAFSVAA